MKIAYLCNSFPEPSETYVAEEIRVLRARRVNVLGCSVRRPRGLAETNQDPGAKTVYLFPVRLTTFAHALWLCASHLTQLSDPIWRAIRGPGPFVKRFPHPGKPSPGS